MKPIELQLQAFGQYLQPQTVRFDKLDPVFLITGETGAGKTTLFDAISYALYGRGLGARKTELRSQLAGDEVSTIVRFRFAVRGVEWLVERSPYQFVRRKRTGTADYDTFAKLQRLTGPDAPEVIAPGEVDDKLRKVVGLRYEDFSKILVLPQGEFQQFLAMKSADRATLLKTLFPVSQHEAVARMAKDAVKEVKTAVDALDAVIKEMLKDFNETRFADDAAQLRTAVTALTVVEKQKQAEQAAAQETLHRAHALAKQIKDLHTKRAEHELHVARQPEQDARIAAQKAAQRAAAVLPVVDTAERAALEVRTLAAQLAVALTEQQRATALLNGLQTAYDALPARRTALQQAVSDAEALARQILDLRQLQLALREQARLDAEAKAKQVEIGQKAALLEAANAAVAELDALVLTRDAARPALDAAEALWGTYAKGEQDARALEDWRLRRAAEALARIHQEQAALERFAQRLATQVVQVQGAQQRFRANAALVVAAALQPGEPCLACGSLEHPQPNRGHAADCDLAELLRQAEKAQDSARDAHTAQDKLVAQLVAAHETAEAAAQQAQARLLDAGFVDAAAWRAAFQAAADNRDALRARDFALAARLAKRPSVVAASTQQNQALEAARTAHQNAETLLAGALATVAALRQRVPDVADVAAALTSAQAQREQATVRNQAEEAAIGQVLLQWQALNNALAAANATHQALATAHAEKQAALPTAELAATTALRDGGFAAVADARAAALSAGQMSILQAQIVDWQSRLTSLTDSIAALVAATTGQPSPDLVAAEQCANDAATAAQKATEARLVAANQLAALQEKALKLAEKRRERELTVKDAQGMLTLSKHLNGDMAPRIDFPTWMLTWWLERVLLKANRRMQTLSDSRYTFALRTTVKDGRACAGLDMDVLDTWSNQRRDVNALSGGEKFQASLALALGLADVVQSLNGGVQLDTLFIDEGFGSLDTGTLDRAMDLINQIAEHRAVGLISHVEAMQKAITSQVRVTKSPNGSMVRVAAGGTE
jgi:exonuclease SbcC